MNSGQIHCMFLAKSTTGAWWLFSQGVYDWILIGFKFDQNIDKENFCFFGSAFDGPDEIIVQRLVDSYYDCLHVMHDLLHRS